MSKPSNQSAFNKAAKPKTKRKGPPPVSVRLTQTEYDQLRHDAGVMSMAAYIRLTLFNREEKSPTRKAYTRKQMTPSSELKMIGHMLGALGESEVAQNLNEIAKGAKFGALPVSQETVTQIERACTSIEEMRVQLIAALGVKVR